MTKEILMVAEAVSNEKGVSEDIIFEAIELALATATKKRYDEEADIHVTIDRESGDYVTMRQWLVVPDDEQVERIGWSFLPCPKTIRGVSDAADLLPHAPARPPKGARAGACGSCRPAGPQTQKRAHIQRPALRLVLKMPIAPVA